MKKFIFILSFFIHFVSFSQTEDEIKMFLIVNELRTNPKSFLQYLDSLKVVSLTTIEKLESDISNYRSGKYRGDSIIKKEWIAEEKFYLSELEDAYNFLNNVSPVPPLLFDETMYQILDTFDKTKSLYQKDEQTVYLVHLSKIKSYQKNWAENLLCSREYYSPVKVVMNFIIDYTVKDRGHRKTLFSTKYTHFATTYTYQTNTQPNLYLCIQNFCTKK